MNPIGIIEINSIQRIEISSSTDDPSLNELIQKYYSWNAEKNSWTYTISTLSQLLGFDSMRYPFTICSTYAQVYWRKGDCKRKVSQACTGDILIPCQDRKILGQMILKGRDPRRAFVMVKQASGLLFSYSSAALTAAFDNNLCVPCLDEQLMGVYLWQMKKKDEDTSMAAHKELDLPWKTKLPYLFDALDPLPNPYFPTGFKALDTLLQGGFKNRSPQYHR